VVLQHAAHEGPGAIGSVLDDIGVEWRCCRLDRGEPVPGPRAADALAGVVAMGGPMSVHDDLAHPWLATERHLLADAVDRGLPVLGVCLGAQQLAVALGAEVTTQPSEELGVGTVTLTGPGRRDPVFGPEYGGLADTSLPCLHWHQDTFSLPDGAVHLAATAHTPHQAFRVGTTAYGLQFHVEVDEALAEAWRSHLPPEVVLHPAEVTQLETVGRRLLTRYVDVVRASRADNVVAVDGAIDDAVETAR
jgi:GMP synthase (glutamine-hydrolysing)